MGKMTPIDYASPRPLKPDPRLGRFAIGFNMIGLAFCFMFVQASWNNPKATIFLDTPWKRQIFSILMDLFFGIALIVGIGAMARRQSRTNLARISVAISIFVVCTFLVI